MLKKMIVCLLCVVAVGCSSAVKISSNPDAAKVYIDGEYKGVTPYVHSDSKPLWGSTDLKIAKEGHVDYQGRLEKTEFNILHIFSYVWFMDYPEEKRVDLQKK